VDFNAACKPYFIPIFNVIAVVNAGAVVVPAADNAD